MARAHTYVTPTQWSHPRQSRMGAMPLHPRNMTAMQQHVSALTATQRTFDTVIAGYHRTVQRSHHIDKHTTCHTLYSTTTPASAGCLLACSASAAYPLTPIMACASRYPTLPNLDPVALENAASNSGYFFFQCPECHGVEVVVVINFVCGTPTSSKCMNRL